MAAFLPGLNEAGYVEGQNVAIEYRWAEGKYDRLPALAADLVARQVTMIATISGTPTALAAKAATTTIPIVFAMGADPVAVGLVSNLGRPGGNVTGVTYFTSVVAAKRVGMLHELTSKTSPMALLVNPNNPPNVEEGETALSAARAMGREARIFNASTASQIEDAFATILQNGSRRDLCLIRSALFQSARQDYRIRGKARLAGDLRRSRDCRSRWTNQLRRQPRAGLSPSRHLRRAHPQGRETRRPAGRTCRPNSISSSTSRPPRRWASNSRRIYSQSPIR